MNAQELKQSRLKSELENNLNRVGDTAVGALNKEFPNSRVLKATDYDLVYVVERKCYGETDYLLTKVHRVGFSLLEEVVSLDKEMLEAFTLFTVGK